MKIKYARILQIIALALAVIAALISCLVAVRPEIMGITGLGMVRAIPTAALGNSIGFVIVDIFYLVMLMRARTAGSTKAAVLISTVLLCLLMVIVEPVFYQRESLQIQMMQAQGVDASTMIGLITAKQGVRELIRPILFISGALSFLSMGGFWGKPIDFSEK